MADLLGCSRNTLLKGISELKNPNIVLKDRIRRKGAGRKSAIETINSIDEVFLKEYYRLYPKSADKDTS